MALNRLELNTFCAALARVCREQVLAEKWLLAPSIRVGVQWLDAVARAGQPVLNVRVMTPRQLAWSLAAPELSKEGLAVLGRRRADMLVSRLLIVRSKDAATSDSNPRGYLGALEPSPDLVRTWIQALSDLRLAGLTAADLRDPGGKVFEVRDKGRELRELLVAYEAELERCGLADHARVLQLAIARLESDPLRSDVLVLAADDMEPGGLERALWQRIPGQQRQRLVVDRREGASLGRHLTRAVGEVNEVRDLLRHCMEQGIPLDEVEILHTDAGTYVPLIFELTSGLFTHQAATFAEGLPVRLFRPGQALVAWSRWIRTGYPQSALVRMIQDGLLRVDHLRGGSQHGFARLGALLRTIDIGAGRPRYLEAIDRRIAVSDSQGEAEEGLSALRELVEQLLGHAPEDDAPAGVHLLRAAAHLLDEQVRVAGQLEEYGRRALLKEIRELEAALVDEGEPPGLDLWEWLAALPSELRVGGEGPRPGRLHVAGIATGGHSGRRQTFILGLDDGRFPGAGLQDPLLLDGERARLSKDLPTAASRLARRVASFERLLARLRGEVTLCHSCRDLVEDRELFAASTLDKLGRDDLRARSPASFAPSRPSRCVDGQEWWLWRMLSSDDAVARPQRVLEDHFPHLARGARARRSRRSDRFTEYDGLVPRAGTDLDPTRPGGPVLSATMLETLGRCPIDYFFRYVLEIERPAEYRLDPDRWLDPLQRGSLLHAVFCDFMRRLQQRELRPSYERDLPELVSILRGRIAAARARVPSPSRSVLEREVRELEQTVQIFLREEELFCRASEPVALEVSIGAGPVGEGTSLDSEQPATLALPSGGASRSIRARGMIDRVDRISSLSASYAVWDYKIASARRYDPADPFKGGRLVQSGLYLAMVQDRLRQVLSPRAEVVQFGYFFPNLKEYGTRIAWSREELARGPQVLADLCQMIAAGCFPCSDDAEDLRFSPYLEAIGDPSRAAQQVRAKLARAVEDDDHGALAPFARLRG
jgi:hypothetical protein